LSNTRRGCTSDGPGPVWRRVVGGPAMIVLLKRVQRAVSGDEVMLLLLSVSVTAYAWSRWYAAAFVRPLVVRNTSRLVYFTGPLVCLSLLYLVLRQWAADDVRDSGTYLTLYMLAGAAWVGLGAQALRFLGVSPRDDVIERQNLAAAVATAGALVGITLCFAGANIGNGPGWWVVVFSATLSTGGFFLLWAVVEWLTGVSEMVTVERTSGSGLRLGGFLAGAGIVLGRAVAGDWVSAEATVRDFVAVAWFVLPLAAVAVIIERLWPFDIDARTEDSAAGLFIAAVYVVVSFHYVFTLQGMP